MVGLRVELRHVPSTAPPPPPPWTGGMVPAAGQCPPPPPHRRAPWAVPAGGLGGRSLRRGGLRAPRPQRADGEDVRTIRHGTTGPCLALPPPPHPLVVPHMPATSHPQHRNQTWQRRCSFGASCAPTPSPHPSSVSRRPGPRQGVPGRGYGGLRPGGRHPQHKPMWDGQQHSAGGKGMQSKAATHGGKPGTGAGGLSIGG